MRLQLGKYHGYGNDFLVFRNPNLNPCQTSMLARDICRPHFGLGADGIAVLERSSESIWSLRLFNRDGSEAEMSGNGARCAAAFIHHRKLQQAPQLILDTLSGRKAYRLLETRQDLVWVYRSEMGEPQFAPASVPCRGKGSEVRHFSLMAAEEEIRLDALSVGNPQCVVLVEELPSNQRFGELGAALERHPFFPRRTNVSFVRVDDSHRITIRIWERGVGATKSSGTGSCGAAVAAIRAGLVRSPVQVATASGEQTVCWKPGTGIELTGSATFVADVDFYWRAGAGS